ncbi:hypothetical protein LYNGBM3L_33350 [Moorena producens 3L]|uniref:Uncharacterized protein n=2 Tax=Coleofasciculaceae TaxID=1892251 RepID=F4XU97_9CYAN|nr:hypothetical protein [Moorena producens]EGJ31722.1 hypothetical protein LYNGBM3L_33350 [Moorena producens 3L]
MEAIELEVSQLKFLLKLLSKPDYRATITEAKPNSKTSAGERDRICQALCDRNLIESNTEITKIQITDAGKELLNQDQADSQLSTKERKILKACETEPTTPAKTNVKPAKTRKEIMDSLIEQGYITVAETKFKDVWITEAGIEYLLNNYKPVGRGNINLSKTMLADYIDFLRKQLPNSTTTISALVNPPTNEEILQIIKNLDQELGTENYLPLFHLRQKLQPPLSREELDKALYSLQAEDKIDLSALEEANMYTEEQIEAGIPQNTGGRLFFIMVQ